ncbi:FAD/NAD(P)-binding domain-containing protein [Obba rivulosa]|uniref:FAD/NAD(P)-binding domain-containing protein n=1 Tax=Obba rivulosa TaxID=1052685 RepID=A0A8E2DST0_9APHY|nr:FAD/NAD(P)-binding domain-containing protein [Obba rivulosa]
MAFSKDFSEGSDTPRVVIMGAGLGGLSFGIALKRQLGFENFTIYEKASDIGGTWRDNTYPGCASDVPTHWYSLSTDLNPYWSRTHVLQPELQAYWKNIAAKYNMYDHVVLNTRVKQAVWDNAQQLYRIELENTRTGERSVTTAQVFVGALGLLSEPKVPDDLKGVDKFKGKIFHTARWNHSVDFHNKRAAVIGNGCSAAQLIPHIVKEPSTTVVNFVRTPVWFVNPRRGDYADWQKWIFANVPGAMRLYRTFLFWELDLLFPVFQGKRNRIRDKMQKDLEKFMLEKTPAKYHDKIIPDYPPACKRLVMETGYLASLHKPNMNVNWDGIDTLVEEGVRTKTGEIIPFDIIVLGTGFVTDEYPVPIFGSRGQSIQQYYKSQGGPTAFGGVTVAGFPNFFMLAGPNTNTSHSSAIFGEEVQINYAVQLIAPVLRGEALSFELTEEASNKYNNWLQRKLANTAYNECVSWYRVGGTGKNFSIFPGPMTQYWWMLRTPKWRDYKAVGADRWNRRRHFAAAAKGSAFVIFTMFLVWAARQKELVAKIFLSFWLTIQTIPAVVLGWFSHEI